MYKFGAAESDELDLNVGDFIEVSVEHPGEEPAHVVASRKK